MLELQGLMSGWAANSQRSRAAPRRWRLLSREAVAQIQTGPIGPDLRTGSQSEQARPRDVARSKSRRRVQRSTNARAARDRSDVQAVFNGVAPSGGDGSLRRPRTAAVQ